MKNFITIFGLKQIKNFSNLDLRLILIIFQLTNTSKFKFVEKVIKFNI